MDGALEVDVIETRPQDCLAVYWSGADGEIPAILDWVISMEKVMEKSLFRGGLERKAQITTNYSKGQFRKRVSFDVLYLSFGEDEYLVFNKVTEQFTVYTAHEFNTTFRFKKED